MALATRPTAFPSSKMVQSSPRDVGEVGRSVSMPSIIKAARRKAIGNSPSDQRLVETHCKAICGRRTLSGAARREMQRQNYNEIITNRTIGAVEWTPIGGALPHLECYWTSFRR
jgi:hypothetical protein